MQESLSQVVPVASPWDIFLWEAVEKTRRALFIISPYLKEETIVALLETLLRRPDPSQPLSVRVITRVLAEEFLGGSSDIVALLHLLHWPMQLSQCTVEIRAINNVHAKVWLFDDVLAIVGSGSATPSGLTGNLEYGLAVSEPQLVARILHDWDSWWMQADPVTASQLRQMIRWLEQATTQLQAIEVQAQEQRKTLDGQLGRPPRLGKRLALRSPTQKSSPTKAPLRIAETPQLYESVGSFSQTKQPVLHDEIAITLDCAQFLHALAWVLPENTLNEDTAVSSAENFLKLVWMGASANPYLSCVWADGKRLSRATLAGHDQQARATWALAIGATQFQPLRVFLVENSKRENEKMQLLVSPLQDGRRMLTMVTDYPDNSVILRHRFTRCITSHLCSDLRA